MKQEHKVTKELVDRMIEIHFPFSWNPYEVTVMEMLDVMPNDLSDWIDNAICLIFWKHFDADTFYVCYQEEWNTKTESYFRWTLPNTLAEMVIWLYENNYISFSK